MNDGTLCGIPPIAVGISGYITSISWQYASFPDRGFPPASDSLTTAFFVAYHTGTSFTNVPGARVTVGTSFPTPSPNTTSGIYTINLPADYTNPLYIHAGQLLCGYFPSTSPYVAYTGGMPSNILTYASIGADNSKAASWTAVNTIQNDQVNVAYNITNSPVIPVPPFSSSALNQYSSSLNQYSSSLNDYSSSAVVPSSSVLTSSSSSSSLNQYSSSVLASSSLNQYSSSVLASSSYAVPADSPWELVSKNALLHITFIHLFIHF
jgi:hypothetical protein